MDMKLQFKDQMVFERTLGYEDDPIARDPSEVKGCFENWYKSLLEITNDFNEHDELWNLANFVNSLAECKIEYTEPLKRFEYNYIFEMASPFSIEAHSPEEADMLAEKYMREHSKELTDNAKAFRGELYSIDRGVTIWEKY